MNLLFFDIECASVYKTTAKICAFGYVLCDENFNILEKKDVLLNPRGKFHLTDRKGDKGIVLPYDYKEFAKCPTFKQEYPRIKNLLENPQNAVLGHATLNDVKYLNLETKRYKLPSFEFSFSDSQLLYMTFKNDFSRQFGLEYIVQDLGLKFTPHRAVDDAYATMKAVEAICRESGCAYASLEEKFKIINGKISNYTITKPTSRGFRRHEAEVRAEKKEHSRMHAKFYDYVNRKKIKKTGKFLGEIFTFSRAVEEDFSVSKKLIDAVYSNGGQYSGHVTHCNFYVASPEDNTPRTQAAISRENIKVLSVTEFERFAND